jgi:CRP/FNR family transcriptional regulator, cyclic AMP receptor protein
MTVGITGVDGGPTGATLPHYAYGLAERTLERYKPSGRTFVELQDALNRGFYGRIPAESAIRICQNATHFQVRARKTVHWDGDRIYVALVVSGLLRVYVMTQDGRQVTVRYVRPSGVLGLAAVAAGSVRANVETVRTTRLMLVERDCLVREARQSAAVAWAVAEETALRYGEALAELADHPSATVRQRVARHLLLLAEVSDEEEGTLLVDLYQHEIANIIGSVREVVARSLRSLREEGILSRWPDGGFAIDDPAALERIASVGL